MHKILMIDDDRAFLATFRQSVAERFPALTVQTCAEPLQGLAAISAELDLLLVDLEMPDIDGAKVLAYATAKGLDRRRIIILSARDADYLHQRFPMGCCLAVLNKHELRQQAVLEMIFASLQHKAEPVYAAAGRAASR